MICRGAILAFLGGVSRGFCGDECDEVNCLLQVARQVPVEFANLHLPSSDVEMMQWNDQAIPLDVASQIGWNGAFDVVGAAVYGGVVKRDDSGVIIVGDEWPDDNRAPPAHNPIHSTGPYFDFSKFDPNTQGYTAIAHVIMTGSADDLEGMLDSIDCPVARHNLANVVMTGGARPLHMCGMSWGGDASDKIRILIDHEADVNAKDNYDLTPLDRLASNSVSGEALLQENGAVSGSELTGGPPDWTSGDFATSLGGC